MYLKCFNMELDQQFSEVDQDKSVTGAENILPKQSAERRRWKSCPIARLKSTTG